MDFRSLKFDDTNPAVRIPCVLLLDTSRSMEGPRIAGLNRALAKFAEDLKADTKLETSVELNIVTFGPVQQYSDFVSGTDFAPPTLVADGPNTPMASAVLFALEKVQERKAFYKSRGAAYHQPWIVLITDGEPTDPQAIPEAARRIRELEEMHKLVFIAAGIEDADMNALAQLSSRPVVPANGTNLTNLFEWLSASLSVKSASRVGEQIPLKPLNMGNA